MASNWYQEGLRRILIRTAGAVDFIADDIQVSLHSSSYTPNKDHDFMSDVTGELSGTGYTGGYGGSGRKLLANKAIGIDDTGDFAYVDADDPIWTGLNAGTPAWAVVSKKGASDAASPVLLCVDVTDLATAGEDYKIQWATPANGGIGKIAA